MIKLSIPNHGVKSSVVKISQANDDIPSNGELLAESVNGLFDLLTDRASLPSWSTKEAAIITELKLIADLLEDLTPPADDQVKTDNPHFGPEIRVVEGIMPYNGQFPEKFTHTVTLGARNSVIPGFSGEKDMIVDAWATYLWHKDDKKWVLGAN